VESQLDVIESKVDAFNLAVVLSQLDIIESKIGEVDSAIDVFISQVDLLNLSEIVSLLDIIDIGLEGINSQVDIVTSKIEAFDINRLESKIDIIDNIVDMTLSKVCDIDVQLGVVESKLDVFQHVESINDSAIISRLGALSASLYDDLIIDQRIESRLIGMDSQLDVVESKIDSLKNTTSINDALILTAIDDISINIDLSEIYSQLDVVESKIDANNCCSTIGAINSKLDVFQRTESINDSAIISRLGALSESLYDDLIIDQRIESRLIGMDSQLDVVESKINRIVGACAPTSISMAQTVSSSGSYALCNNITGTITIAASNVMLDLNNYKISAGIVVNSGLDQIAMRNGVVEGTTNGILVNSGTKNVIIENITVKNATLGSGIKFTNVTDATINGCTLTMNTTGLQLSNSHKINVSNTIADCNRNAGFDLISSTTNTFLNCKSLGTGQGNTVTSNNLVTGFVSLNGYGNIFERCIANSTQALSTVDSNSLIAGFALRGHEGGSKIIECEAANSTSSPNGYTIPYGILLEGSISSLISLTGGYPNASNDIYAVEWSPDGQYIALGGDVLDSGTGNEVQIVKFDRVANSLTTVTGVQSLAANERVNSLSWSSDGQYLAVALKKIPNGAKGLLIYSFDRQYGTLTLVASQLTRGTSGESVNSVSWSPNGQFLVAGGLELSGNTGNELQVFSFNRVAGTLTFVTSAISVTSTEQVTSVDWSPDGQYIAVGGIVLNKSLKVFKFDTSPGILTLVAEALGNTDNVYSVSWSPDGQYIAVGGFSLSGGDDAQVFRFNRADASLVKAADSGITGATIYTVSWSPDGQYLIIGGDDLTGGTNDEIQLFKFDRSQGALTSIAGIIPNTGEGRSLHWSPDGQYIALGGKNLSGNELQILNGLQFPNNNVITQNTVYCNSGGIYPSGVGISGPSICNFIVDNNAYSNPIPSALYKPVVPTNYYFVCNVFNQLSGQAPTALQNIALGGCEVISPPEDSILLLKQNKFLLYSLIDMVAAI
jgi:Periplasmic component of the Tol biopolymer transport system